MNVAMSFRQIMFISIDFRVVWLHSIGSGGSNMFGKFKLFPPDHILGKFVIDLCFVCLNRTKWMLLKRYRVDPEYHNHCHKPAHIGIKIRYLQNRMFFLQKPVIAFHSFQWIVLYSHIWYSIVWNSMIKTNSKWPNEMCLLFSLSMQISLDIVRSRNSTQNIHISMFIKTKWVHFSLLFIFQLWFYFHFFCSLNENSSVKLQLHWYS